jgi:hypothetical protein
MTPSLKLRLYAFELGIPRSRRNDLFAAAQELTGKFAEHRDIQILAYEVVGRSRGSNEIRFLCHAIDQTLRSRFKSPYRARAMIFTVLLNNCTSVARSGDLAEATTGTDRLCEMMAKKVIADLQNVTDLGLGEDTGLANVWEEICVQRQGEESAAWEAYEETVRVLIEAHLEDLTTSDRCAVWFETDKGVRLAITRRCCWHRPTNLRARYCRSCRGPLRVSASRRIFE